MYCFCDNRYGIYENDISKKPDPIQTCGPKQYYRCGYNKNRVVNVRERSFNEEITSNRIGCFEMGLNNYSWKNKIDVLECSEFCFFSDSSSFSVFNDKYNLSGSNFYLINIIFV